MGRALLTSILLCLSGAAYADEIVGSIGYEGRNGVHGAMGTVEYHRMTGSFGRLDYGVGGAAMLGEGGGHWVGVGGVARYGIGSDYFVEGTFMPGYQLPGERDLGGPFQFRTLIGAGREVAPGQRVSVAISHRSNGPLYEKNPGIEALSLRYGREF